MAMTNAERHARWRARHKQEVAELRAKPIRSADDMAREAAELAERELRKAYRRAYPPEASGPRPLPANVRKASSNQYDRRESSRPSSPRVILVNAELAKKAFSDRMCQARIAAGLSQAQVAEALFGPGKVYVKRYINWEIGRSPMALEVIPIFARLVGVDCNFLFS